MSTYIESCWICNGNAHQNEVTIRGGQTRLLSICDECDFHFFAKDNSADLAEDRLDQIRLESAGLKIPDLEQDFANGLKQSESLVEEYIKNCSVGEDILEVGCSYGYFLKRSQAYGVNVHGVEINTIRAKYVEHIGIPCRHSINEYLAEGFKFDKIFLFYVFEYINTPKDFLQNLVALLKENGSIILITPNLHDVIKDVYKNQAFKNFFYDDCSVAYYSIKAMQILFEKIKLKNVDITIKTEQGYSIVNHINWYLNDRPRTTGIVGGDNFFEQMCSPLYSDSNLKSTKDIRNLLTDFDAEYKRVIESNDLGNRVIIKIKKNAN